MAEQDVGVFQRIQELRTVHNLTYDQIADRLRKETQKMIALRLNLLGWTQDEQAAAIGMQSQGSYHKFLSQFSDLKKEIKKSPFRRPPPP